MTGDEQLLGDLCEIITKGTTPTTLGMRFAEEGVPFVRVNNFASGHLKLNSETLFVSAKTHKTLSRSIIKGGDVLLSIAGTIGKSCVVPDDSPELNCNQAVCVIRPKQGLLFNRYLHRWLSSAEAFSQVADGKVTGVISNLSLANVRGLRIRLPSWNEQKRIAAILDTADAIRRKRQQALRLTDAFVRSVFLDMFGDPKASGWSMTSVEGVSADEKGSIRTGPFGSQLLHSEFVDDGIAVLGIDNAVTNQFAWAKPRFISKEKYAELERYTVCPGDVLITIMGTCGRCAVVPDDVPTAINTKHLCCITLDHEKCLPEFLHAYFLIHPLARRYLALHSKGAIMDGLNMGLIKGLPVPEAPIALQREFTRIVSKRSATNTRLATHSNEAEALFTSLQQRAFRGEL